jgi:peptidoglycan-associated lipoprotein
MRDVFFDFDRYAIKPEAARTLDASIGWLKSNPGVQVLVEGHCDERGTNAYNLVLGERRAKAAQDYLVARGIEASRIATISYGEERPGCAERNESCWSRNRRAHFLAKQP